MRAPRAVLVTFAVALIMPIAGGAASADVEWCDSGSPPPNDFRFRMTGSPSSTSSLSWLASTTGGELDLDSGTNTLEGGVARGMWMAILRAPSAYDTQVRDRGGDDDDDRDDDDDDDDDDDSDDGDSNDDGDEEEDGEEEDD